MPGPARLEFLARQRRQLADDARSRIRRATSSTRRSLYRRPAADPAAHARRHAPADREALAARTRAGSGPRRVWRKDFGGKFSRMRDAEVADLYGDGRADDRRRDPRPGRRGGAARRSRTAASRSSSSTASRTPSCTRSRSATSTATACSRSTRRRASRTASTARRSPARWCATCPPARRGPRAWWPTSASATRRRSWSRDVDGDGRDELYVSVEGERRRGRQAAGRAGRDPPLRRRHADPNAGARDRDPRRPPVPLPHRRRRRRRRQAGAGRRGVQQRALAAAPGRRPEGALEGRADRRRLAGLRARRPWSPTSTATARDELYVASDDAQGGAPLRLERTASSGAR